MTVDPQQLLDDGYVIIRNAIPPDHLDALRASFEALVEKQKTLWAQARGPNDPPGGAWETSPQPRLQFGALADEATINTIDFCLHDHTMGVSRQLMRAPDAAVTGMMFMCSPARDHGPSHWHRDIHPIDQAPLRGLEIDLLANAPGYLQWNIPLYDDSVLWVVPGSHRRPNTADENRQLTDNPRVPLPHSIPVELNAGDGVVYTNTILHWGSNYSAKLRRTIHLGYRSFGGPILPYVMLIIKEGSFIPYLSPSARATFDRHFRLYAQQCDVITTLFRALIDKDESSFRDALAVLHPGEHGRIVCLIQLSKIVYKMRFRPDRYGGDISQDKDLAPRFSPSDLDTLWQRFATLDARIQADAEQFVPGFQSGPMRYFFEEMPADFGVDEFIASWKA